MKTTRKTYSCEFKLEALQLLESSGKSAAQIARDLGIPEGSLYRWRNEFRARGDHAFPGQGNLPADQEELHKLRRENEILRQERDILKKAIAIFTRLCQMLSVSASGYYAWRKRPTSAREMANQQLVERIKIAHANSYETYGSPRIYHELCAQGVACSENRVARLMRLHGIHAVRSKRYRATTKRNKAHHPAPNLLKRDFSAQQPNEKWASDITEIPTAEGKLYAAFVMDLFSRRVVGWAMSARMT